MLIPCDYRPCTSNLGRNKFEELEQKNKNHIQNVYTSIHEETTYIIAFTRRNNHVSNSFLEYICIHILKSVKI